MAIMNCFCEIVDQRMSIKSCVELGPQAEVFIIENLLYPANRT